MKRFRLNYWLRSDEPSNGDFMDEADTPECLSRSGSGDIVSEMGYCADTISMIGDRPDTMDGYSGCSGTGAYHCSTSSLSSGRDSSITNCSICYD